jgi:type IV pilus assembly protein PilM
MFSSLWRSKCWPIALDVGADGVKMLQMQASGRTASVRAAARARFGQVHADPRARAQAASAAVAEILAKAPFRGRLVVSSLPCAQLAIKNIRVPHMSPEQADSVIRAEAAERFGGQIDPDKLSYLHAGEVRQGNETRDEIIMLAATQEVVDLHLSMLQQAGLEPAHIDAEPVALFRGFTRFGGGADEQTIAVLVEIGRSGARLVVGRGRQIVFLKNVEIGGEKFNEAVASHLNLSLPEAAELRVRLMSEQQQAADAHLAMAVRDGMRSQVEELGKEIALCLRYCSVTFRGLRPSRVTLTGGEAYDPAIASLLQQHLGIECVVGEPLKGIQIPPSAAPEGRSMLAEWAVCCGLALRNMTPQVAIGGEHEPSRLSA